MNKEIAAIILAAGRGKRMKSQNVNKVVLPLRGKPMILHTLDILKELHMSPIIVVVGFAKQSVIDVLKDNVIYAEQNEQLGTAHAVTIGMGKVPQDVEHILILNGDDSAFYTKEVIQKLIDRHIYSYAAISFLTMKSDNPFGIGRIVRDTEGNVMKVIEEKDATEKEKQIKEINIACYLFNADFLRKYLKQVKRSEITGEYYLTNLIEIAYNHNEKIEAVTEDTIKWRGINTQEELREAEELFMENIFKPENFFDLTNCSFVEIFEGKTYVWEVLKNLNEFMEQQFKNGKVTPNYKDSKNISIGDGTVIEEGAFIKGPVIIGRNCFIGHGAYIRQNCLLEDNVSIGHASEVKNSIIFSNSAIAHLNYVGDSIVGHKVNIGGGAKIANFRLDGKTISVKSGDNKIDTGLTKFGAILGDETKIGVNAVLNPGTVLGKHVLVYPLQLVYGTHAENSIIK